MRTRYLDATNPDHAGIYTLRDFVTTGDALRIKLPIVNEETEYPEWIWIENHQGYNNNGCEFDRWQFDDGQHSCIEGMTPGMMLLLQINNERRIANESDLLFKEGFFADYTRPLLANGHWDMQFFTDSVSNDCVSHKRIRPFLRYLENPLTGANDQDSYTFDIDGNNTINKYDQLPIWTEKLVLRRPYPDGPLKQVMIDGHAGFVLPEVTITPSDESPNYFEEFEFTPYSGGNAGYYNGYWNNGNVNGTTIRPGRGGSGGKVGSRSRGTPIQKRLEKNPPIEVTTHTGDYLFINAYWHYQFGNREPFWVDASTLNLNYISQKDLLYNNEGIASINLFDYSKTAQSALVLGKISLEPIGDNMFAIMPDNYDFNIEWEKGLTKRNVATIISGILHGPVLDNVPLPTYWVDGKPCYVQPSVYWGGPYTIYFFNFVYIKPY